MHTAPGLQNLVKIDGNKLLLLSLRAGSKTIFVVANLWGFERPRSMYGNYSSSVCPQVYYKVINNNYDLLAGVVAFCLVE